MKAELGLPRAPCCPGPLLSHVGTGWSQEGRPCGDVCLYWASAGQWDVRGMLSLWTLMQLLQRALTSGSEGERDGQLADPNLMEGQDVWRCDVQGPR